MTVARVHALPEEAQPLESSEEGAKILTLSTSASETAAHLQQKNSKLRLNACTSPTKIAWQLHAKSSYHTKLSSFWVSLLHDKEGRELHFSNPKQSMRLQDAVCLFQESGIVCPHQRQAEDGNVH